MTETGRQTAARLMVAGAAALFSTGGAAIKAAELSGWQVASFRSGVAAIALLLLVKEARRGWSWRSWLAGVAYAATLVLFVLANKTTTAANAIFLQSTAPAWLILISPLALREPLRRRDLWFFLALAAGMALFFTGSQAAQSTAPQPTLGNIYGAFSGLTYAVTLAALRWQAHAAKAPAALATVAAGNIIACVACLPMALPAAVGGIDAAVILYLGVIQIGLAYLLLTRGMKSVRAFEASTLLLVEPVLNPIWAWAIQGETPGAWALAGGGVILASTLVHIWRERRTAE
jgi:drug/metabolite transporter (DMT)-like permease